MRRPNCNVRAGMATEYYHWSVDRKPVEVRLNLAVVDRLQALASWAFHNAAKEIHGILLGRIERRGHKRRVYIEEMDLFDPATGPPRSRRRSWFDCVGLFRSHVREGLRLDHVDASLISNYFTNPGMVYLLVRPEDGAPSTAGFFIQEDGRVRGYGSYVEFPFHSEALRTGRFRVVAESELGSSPSRWKWIAGVTALVVALIAGWWFWPRLNVAALSPLHTAGAPNSPARAAAPTSRTPAVAPAPGSTSAPPAGAPDEVGDADRGTPGGTSQHIAPRRDVRGSGRTAVRRPEPPRAEAGQSARIARSSAAG